MIWARRVGLSMHQIHKVDHNVMGSRGGWRRLHGSAVTKYWFWVVCILDLVYVYHGGKPG